MEKFDNAERLFAGVARAVMQVSAHFEVHTVSVTYDSGVPIVTIEATDDNLDDIKYAGQLNPFGGWSPFKIVDSA